MSARLSTRTVVRRTFGIYAEHATVLMMAAIFVGVLDVLSNVHTDVTHSLAVAVLIGNPIAFLLFTGFVVLLAADVCEGRTVRPVGDLLWASARAFFPLLLVLAVAVLVIALLLAIAPLLIISILVGAAFALPLHASHLPFLGLLGGALFVAILLQVLALMLMIRWSVAVPIVVLERPGRLRALRNSRKLVSGNSWRVFALIVLLVLTFTLFSGTLTSAAATAGGVPALAVRILLATLIVPIPVLAAVVLYFELRRGDPTSAQRTDGVASCI
jgi:hypothetical protein